MSQQIAKNMIFRQNFVFRGDTKVINWFPGHMLKGLRQMKRALLETDCVIEVHDARIPYSGRNVKLGKDLVGAKPHILVLNKKDLVFEKSSKNNKQQQDFKESIMEKEPNLSDVIFTNCTDSHCKGLKSVSETVAKLIFIAKTCASAFFIALLIQLMQAHVFLMPLGTEFYHPIQGQQKYATH